MFQEKKSEKSKNGVFKTKNVFLRILSSRHEYVYCIPKSTCVTKSQNFLFF
jgi:hypothetical protein